MLQNDESTITILTYEIGDVGGETLDHWMQTLETETGISKENVFIHAEHVHSAPYAGSDCEEDVGDVEKTEQFKQICLEAAIAAIKDCQMNLEPAKVSVGPANVMLTQIVTMHTMDPLALIATSNLRISLG